MRWLTTIATIAGLGVLGHIVWKAEGPKLLEKLHLDGLLPAKAEPTIDVETLVEMCDGHSLKNELNWKVAAKLERPAFATFGSINSRAFLGGGASEEETRAAMLAFQHQIDSAVMAGERQDVTTPRGFASIRPSQSGANSSTPQSTQNQDYKRIPRMLGYGLSHLQRFGGVNAFGQRDMIDQTRLGQQQRELDRLRARRDNYNKGKTVYRD